MDLSQHLRQARWFGGKGRTIEHTRVIDRACWADNSALLIVEVTYTTGAPDTYVLVEHIEEPPTARALLHAFRGSTITTESGGALEFRPTHVFGAIARRRTEPIALMTAEQSNTSIRFGDALILKLFRRLQFGPNPDVEVGWLLTEHSAFRGTPRVAGSAEYVSADGRTASLALLQEFVANVGDAWSTTVARLRDVVQGGDPSDSLASIARLGATTADMHLALAGGEGDFAPEPIGSADSAAWRGAIHDEVKAACEALAQRQIAIDPGALTQRADGVASLEGSPKIRHHGDYHLGQVLERADGEFVVIDFEGEPAKPLAQRREKRSPLRDVAGMLRSLDYARHAAVRAVSPTEGSVRADAWYRSAREAYLHAYLGRVRAERPDLVPTEIGPALAALELEKAAYEVLYELNNRPAWLPIPLAAFTAA